MFWGYRTTFKSSTTFAEELKALVASGTLALDESRKAFLAQISTTESFDWTHFFNLACKHRLVGVVNHHIRNGVLKNIPQKVANDFASLSKRQGIVNLWLASQLIELLTALNRAGIPAISYKGPALAQQLYGDLELRASADLDVIVQPQDLLRTRDCLLDLGFQDGYGLPIDREEIAFHFGAEHCFYRGELSLDLHWRITQHWRAPSLDMDGVFLRAAPRALLGTECLCLGDEDQVVALLIHAAQHDWTQMSNFIDVLEVLRHTPQLDWDLVRAQMADSHSLRALLVCLKIISECWFLELPDWCQEAISKDTQLDEIAGMIWCNWGSHELPTVGRQGMGVRDMLKTTRGEDLRHRFAFVVGSVVEPKIPDFLALGLPRGLWWFYWIFRPFRLLWKRRSWLSFRIKKAT